MTCNQSFQSKLSAIVQWFENDVKPNQTRTCPIAEFNEGIGLLWRGLNPTLLLCDWLGSLSITPSWLSLTLALGAGTGLLLRASLGDLELL